MTRLDVYPITLEDCAKQWRADQDGYIVMKSRAEAAEERIITLRAERNAADTLLSEAEARAAQLEAKLHLAHVESQSAWDSEAQWKAAANRLQAEGAAHREQQAEIRELVNAYSEHDTVEAVRRMVELLTHANERIGQLETNRDELAHKIDALYKQIEDLET